MVSCLISNWFILGPTERSLNSCSVIATQPTSLPYPIFIQVDYKWATWTYTNSPPQPMTGIHGNTTTPTNSTHLYTSGLQGGIPTTSLCTPLNPSMFSCIAFMPKKCGLKNKKKYFLCFITLQSLQWAQMSLSSPQHTLSGHVPAQKGLKRG